MLKRLFPTFAKIEGVKLIAAPVAFLWLYLALFGLAYHLHNPPDNADPVSNVQWTPEG